MKIDGLKLLFAYNGKPLYEEDTGLIVGQVASSLIDMSKIDESFLPEIEWTGSIIPNELIRRCASFSKWCFNQYGGEVQGRLFYNKLTGEFRTLVLKQFVSRTLESKECGEAGDIEAVISSLPAGFNQIGTWHSHANIPASMSITDYNDEIKQNGIHITLGSFNDAEFTINVRISHNGIMYQSDQITNSPVSDDIKRSNHDLPEFNFCWTDMLVERPVRAVAIRNRSNERWHKHAYYEPVLISDESYSAIVKLIKSELPNEDLCDVLHKLLCMSTKQNDQLLFNDEDYLLF